MVDKKITNRIESIKSLFTSALKTTKETKLFGLFTVFKFDDKKISSLQSQIDLLINDYGSIETQHSDEKAKMLRKMNEKSKTIKSLESDLLERDREITDLKHSLDNLQKQNAELSKENSKQGYLAADQAKIQTLESDLSKVTAECENLSHDKEVLETNLKVNRNDYNQLASFALDLNNRLSRLKAEITAK